MVANSYATHVGASATQPGWNARVASYLVALHAYQEYRIDVYEPAIKAINDLKASGNTPLERGADLIQYQFDNIKMEIDRRANSVLLMLRELIAYPSPKLSDLLTKMEIAKANDITSLAGAPELFDHIVEDMRRLNNHGDYC